LYSSKGTIKNPYIIKNLNIKKMENLTKTQKVTKVKNTKKPLIEKTENGLVINEQVSGKKLERILTSLQESKRDLKNVVNEKRNSLSYNLKLIKDDCKNESSKYVKELNQKYELSLKSTDIFGLLCTPSAFIPYLTDAQKIKFTEKRLNFTPSLIIEAISRYFKNMAKNSL
jgi:hypothetical protein